MARTALSSLSFLKQQCYAALGMRLDDLCGRVSDWSGANGFCLNVSKTVDIKLTASCIRRLHSQPVHFLGIHHESGWGGKHTLFSLYKNMQ